MHPAVSVIVFTVSSGAGLGLLALSIFLMLIEGGDNARALLISTVTGLILTALGLISSTFHLANPKNAWRAFSRFRSSWLSREGVFAVLLYPFALVYLGELWHNPEHPGLLAQLAGVIAALLALATLFATGMIYACLRTIRQWNTALVPANYLLLGLATGGLILTLFVNLESGGNALAAELSLIFLTIAGLGKALYYLWIGKPQGPTINTATGFTRASVKLLDAGHSAGTFHTREFGYQAPVKQVSRLRWGSYLLGFIVPALLTAWVIQSGGPLPAALAVLSALIGVVIERWLFFAEARHSVNLYHGQQRV